MHDVDVWCTIRQMCQRFPLQENVRKEHASPLFGFQDVMLIEDLCQLPPASGKPPLVTIRSPSEIIDFRFAGESPSAKRL